MFAQAVRSVMRHSDVVAGPPEMPVSAAAKLMATRRIGAVMVVERDALIGIFTERDIVFRVVARGLDPEGTTVGEVMTAAPRIARPEQTLGAALLAMHDGGFRHLPVVDNGRLVGLLSAPNPMDPELEEFVSEVQRRKHYGQERA